jgi:hypothetical protein
MFSVVEEWRDIEDHPKYEISNLGTIRHKVSKKIRIEPNRGFRYYEDGVRKSIPIHILLDRAFPGGG